MFNDLDALLKEEKTIEEISTENLQSLNNAFHYNLIQWTEKNFNFLSSTALGIRSSVETSCKQFLMNIQRLKAIKDKEIKLNV